MEVTDQMLDDLIKKVLPLSVEWKKQWVRGRGAQGKATCPLCGGTIAWVVSGHGNRHSHAKCDGCWVQWQE